MADPNGETQFDVAVVGGGWGGIAAARDLSDEGHHVVVLEARDRIGGRTWYRKLADTDHSIEFGGQFLKLPIQPYVAAEVERYGAEIEQTQETKSFTTILKGKRYDAPGILPIEQAEDLERALFYVTQAARRITPGTPLDLQRLTDLDISWRDFWAPLQLPAETQEFLDAFPTLWMGRRTDEASALHMLGQLANYRYSPWFMNTAMGEFYKHGTKSVLDRMVADIRGEVRLECPVARVAQDDRGVKVTTRGGDVVTARAAVIALPLNLYNDVEFDPPLNTHRRAASAEQHGTTRSGRLNVIVRNAPPAPVVMMGPDPHGFAALNYQETLENGDQLMEFFMLMGEGDPMANDPWTEDAAQKAIEIVFPEAKVVAFDHHNWNTDEFSKGDWLSMRPGRFSVSHSHLNAPEGRLFFAGSDIALGNFAQMDGAIETGRRAARHATALLSRDRQGVTAAA